MGEGFEALEYAMKKCLRLLVSGEFGPNVLEQFIQKNAKKLGFEGTAQKVGDNQILISVCGFGDSLDDFMDILHKGTSSFNMYDLEVEPFLKDKDYRDVFRIIE